MVYNPQTTHITPQYHVTYDEGFTLVCSMAATNPADRDVLLLKLYEKATWLFKSPYSANNNIYDFSSFWMDPPPTDFSSTHKQKHEKLHPTSVDSEIAPKGGEPP